MKNKKLTAARAGVAPLSDGEGRPNAGMGDRIRQIRKEKLGLDQAGLAERIGVSHGTVSYWERGGFSKPDNLRKLAEVAGVTVEWLLNGVVDPADQRFKVVIGRVVALPDTEVEYYINLLETLLNERDRLVRMRRDGA